MKDQFLEWFASLREILCQEQSKFARRIWRIGFVLTLGLIGLASAAAQNPPDAPPNPDALRCAALTEFNLEVAPADVRSSLPRISSKRPRVVWRGGR
jgi:hypothetical protein